MRTCSEAVVQIANDLKSNPLAILKSQQFESLLRVERVRLADPNGLLLQAKMDHFGPFPEGRARHLDVAGQKLSPHCLAIIFGLAITLARTVSWNASQIAFRHKRGLQCLSGNYPRGEGNWAAPKALLKDVLRTMRAMRGKTLETILFLQPYFGCT